MCTWPLWATWEGHWEPMVSLPLPIGGPNVRYVMGKALWVREGRHRQSWHVPWGLMGWLAFLKGNLPSDGTSHLPTTSAQDSLPGLKYCYLAPSPKGRLTPLAQTPGHLPSSSTPGTGQQPLKSPGNANKPDTPRVSLPFYLQSRFFLPATPDGEGLATSREMKLCPGSGS